MSASELDDHLSEISTQWTILFQAQQGSADTATLAQQVLLQRYSRAIYRYLLRVLHNSDSAMDLAQEFALRFIQGDFKHVHPEHGRFRDYVKTVLINLIIAHQKQKQALPQTLPPGVAEPAVAPADLEQMDQEFVSHWREELLARAWEALAQTESQTGQPYYSVLRFRAENPKKHADEMAAKLGTQLERSFTVAAIRQTLHRARQKFAALLLDEVARSLHTERTDRLEQELVDLGLLAYCRSALARRGRPSP